MHRIPDEHVLIIDDTQTGLVNLKVILEMHGYMVQTAENGVSAIHAAVNSPPDIILLDIEMPDFSGFDVCVFLKNYEETEDIPVIFVSGYSQAENILKAFANGGIDFIAKPFHVDEVIARINSHLEIKRLKKRLASQVEELSEFASMMAHDIKGPLALVQGFADQLSSHWEEIPQENQIEILDKIQRHATKSSNIVDEILKLALISQEQVIMHSIEMETILEQVKLRIDPYLENFGGSVHYASNWPCVLGHAPWIEEVWVNYISNALKYGGNPATVEIGFSPVSDQHVKFWVKDNGPGLTVEEQNRLFIKHQRIHKSGHPKGHGLGLSIVKRIVEKLMGEVGVDSQKGEGSTFTFTLRTP